MAFAHVSLVGKTGDNSGSLATIATDAFNLVAGNLVVFGVTAGANVNPSVAPTDTAGNTYTELTSCRIADSTNGQFIWAYYCANCAGNAANVITVTWAAAKANRGILGGQYSGLSSGAVDVQIGQLETAPGTGADGCNSTTQTNTSQPAMLWGLVCNTGSLANNPTTGTGFTVRSNGMNLGGGSDQARYEDKRLTALAAVESTFTAVANNSHITIMAVFDEPVASCAITGTAIASITEDDIVAGGKTIIATLTNATFVADTISSPTLRGVGAFGSGTTSFTAAVPTSANAPQSGDAMYIIMESTDSTTTAGTPSTPGGWNKLFENTIAAGSSVEPAVSTLTIFGKIAGASESNVSVTGVGNHCAGAMIVVAGHGLAAITDTVVGSATNHGTSTTNVLAPSINVTAGSFIITCMGLGDDAADTTNVTGVTNANLAGITERIDQTVSTGSGGGVGIYTSTCAGTSTGTTEWDHDTAASSQSMQMGIAPPATTPFANAIADFIAGLDSAQSETHGWDADVKAALDAGDFSRDSPTQVTITLPAVATYDITAQETITVTVPTSAIA